MFLNTQRKSPFSASEHLKKIEKQLREKNLDLEMKQKAAYSVKT